MIESDILKRAQRHLRQMAPHVRERETARLLVDLVEELKREHGRPLAEETTMNDYENQEDTLDKFWAVSTVIIWRS